MLCKERKRFIKQAVEHRYALAAAHVCYIHSLRNTGFALRNFVEEENFTLVEEPHSGGSSPMLKLPTTASEPIALPEKPQETPLPPQSPSSPSPSPTPPQSPPGTKGSPASSSPDDKYPPQSYESPHYLRALGNPTMSVEERHPSLRMDSYVLPQYGMTDFFGATMPLQAPLGPAASYDNGSITGNPDYPPPPPSPPKTFSWDFFNPFTSLEGQFAFQEHRRSSHNSEDDLKQVREEEGIPDLEEDDHGEEKREMQVQERTVEVIASTEKSAHGREQTDTACVGSGDGDEANVEEKLLVIGAKKSVEVTCEQQVEAINALSDEVSSEQKDLAVFDSSRMKKLFDVIRDIEDQFIRAYDSGKEVAMMLEASKVHYHSGFTEIKEHSAKVLNAITWHRSTSSRSPLSKPDFASSSKEPIDVSNSDFGEDGSMISGSHASTLDRLLVWEKKLYEEVKAGERTRIMYEKKCVQLRKQDAKGEDPQVVDKTRATIRDLHTRIRVAIQAVDSVSKKIQKLRDEELQPQLVELIQGLMRMWKVMLESHQTQNQIIAEAKSLGSSGCGRVSSESQQRATVRLESELRKWHTSFSNWIAAQKAYVQALNGWLLKCIIQEPEGSLKERVPFSPRRLGAPPIFSICKDWSVAFDALPERAVVHAIGSFAADMRTLLGHQDEEQRQKWKADRVARDLDKRLVFLQRNEGGIVEHQHTPNEKYESDSATPAIDRRMSIDSFRKRVEEETAKHQKFMQQTHHATLNTLKTGLIIIFESLADFAAESVETYEKLYKHNEREKLTYENGNVQHIKDG